MRIERASFGHDAWTRDDFLAYFAQTDRCIFLVAITGGHVAGYAIGYLYNARAEVDSIAVSPARRRLGVARALMVRLKQAIRRRGRASLSLAVRLDNPGAIELYRELGFQRVRRVEDFYNDGAPAWRMRASLTA